jgi:hypothetical protein
VARGVVKEAGRGQVGARSGGLPLIIRLTKRADGGAVLHCERADGSVTWQRQDGARAAFFPLHDLAHYAVETELGLRRGFFGLLAEGWDIADTEGKGARGPLPAAALLAEHVVGWLDSERASGAVWSAAELAEYLTTRLGANAFTERGAFAETELARVRARMAELHHRWRELPSGGALELRFECGSGTSGTGSAG